MSSARFPANSGVGAAKSGGRWNPTGFEAIYAAESRSLAALEILVHYEVLPFDYLLTEITIPDTVEIFTIDASVLPAGWDGPLLSPATQQLGLRWLVEERFAVLSVPSSVVPQERNFVLNPKHPSFGEIDFSVSRPFQFDPRLK